MNIKLYNHFIYYLLVILGQISVVWGSFFILKFPNLSYFDAIRISIPFCWLNWLFLSPAIALSKKEKLLTETQNIFSIVLIQFFLVILINKYYLKQKIYRSDIIAFFIILFAYYISVKGLSTSTFLTEMKNDNNNKNDNTDKNDKNEQNK